MTWRRAGARTPYFVLAALLAAGVVVQVYLAGLGVFHDTGFGPHKGFVHALELLPIVLALVGFAGGAPKPLRWIPVGVFFLFGLQYATARAPVGTLGALHAVNALAILALAAWLASASRPQRRATAAPLTA